MTPDRTVQGFIIAAAAALVVGGQVWGNHDKAGPIISAASAYIRGDSTESSAARAWRSREGRRLRRYRRHP